MLVFASQIVLLLFANSWQGAPLQKNGLLLVNGLSEMLVRPDRAGVAYLKMHNA